MLWTDGKFARGVEMQALYALLCTDTEPKGKSLTAIRGMFNKIVAEKIPYTAPDFYVVFQMRLIPSEWNEKDVYLDIRLVNFDGEDVQPKTHHKLMWDKEVVKPGRPKMYFAVVLMKNIKFEKYGDYEFSLTVMDKPLATIPIYVDPE